MIAYPFEVRQTHLGAEDGGLVLVVQHQGARVEPPLALVAPQQEGLAGERDGGHVELGLEGDDAVVAAEVAEGVVAHRQVVEGALDLRRRISKKHKKTYHSK